MDFSKLLKEEEEEEEFIYVAAVRTHGKEE